MSAVFRAITYVCATVAILTFCSEDGNGGPGLFTFWGCLVFVVCVVSGVKAWHFAKFLDRYDAERAAK